MATPKKLVTEVKERLEAWEDHARIKLQRAYPGPEEEQWKNIRANYKVIIKKLDDALKQM